MPYEIRAPRGAGFVGYRPQSAPTASPSVAPASGAVLSGSEFGASGLRPPHPSVFKEAAQIGGERAHSLHVLCEALAEIGSTPDRLTNAMVEEGGEFNRAVLDKRRQIATPHKAAERSYRDAFAAMCRDVEMARASGKTLVDVPVDLPADIDLGELGEKISEITVEEQETREAWPPLEVAISDIHSQAETLAAPIWASVDLEARGSEQHVRSRLGSFPRLHFRRITLDAAPLHEGGELGTVIDAEAMLCWMGEFLAEKIGVNPITAKPEADLEAAYQGYSGLCLTQDQIRDRLRELDKAKIALQRQAAALVWRAIDAGDMSVMFPPGMNGLAVIGVEATGGKQRKIVPYDDLRR